MGPMSCTSTLQKLMTRCSSRNPFQDDSVDVLDDNGQRYWNRWARKIFHVIRHCLKIQTCALQLCTVSLGTKSPLMRLDVPCKFLLMFAFCLNLGCRCSAFASQNLLSASTSARDLDCVPESAQVPEEPQQHPTVSACMHSAEPSCLWHPSARPTTVGRLTNI